MFFPLVYTSWLDLHNTQSLEEFRSIINDFRTNSQDFNELVENHPFPVDEVKVRPEMRIWSWLTHNMVNKKNGKPWVTSSIMNTYPLVINMNNPVDSPAEWLDPEGLDYPDDIRSQVLEARRTAK